MREENQRGNFVFTNLPEHRDGKILQPYKMTASEFGQGAISWAKETDESDYPHFMTALEPGIINELGGKMHFNLITKSKSKVRIAAKEVPLLDIFTADLKTKFDLYH